MVVDEFVRYDTGDLLSSVAALQLLPANASALGRLESAAGITAAQAPDAGRHPMPLGRLRTALNTPPFTTTLNENDPPFDELLVEPLAFHGGLYLVSPGLGREAVYATERLLRALFLMSELLPNSAFEDQARRVCMAGLRVSDLVLKRAGLTRYAMPEGRVRDPVTSGTAAEFASLKQGVRFSTQELAHLLRPLTLADLAPLVQDLGSSDLPLDQSRGGPLHVRPIVRNGNDYIVALPLGLLEAVRHAVLASAVHHGCEPDVARRFRAAVADDVESSLTHMGLRDEPVALPALSDLPIVELVYRLDDDKLLYAQILTEDFKGYDAAHAYGKWEKTGLDLRLDGRRRRVERELTKASPPGTSVMYLAVTQLVGREWTLQFDLAGTRPHIGPQLGLSAADLQVIAELEDSNAVALFKYAENRALAAPNGHPAFLLDQLGTYALYRAHGYSLRMDYHDADMDKPWQYVGAGLHLRAEAKRRRDVHAAHFDGNHGVSVARWDEDGKDPIYVAVPPPDLSMPFLVDGLPAPIWVFGPQPQSAEEAEGNHHFMYMVAFWLWQLTDDIREVVAAAAKRRNPLHIRLALGKGRKWLQGPPTGSKDLGEWSLDTDGTIHIRLGAGNFDELRQESNAGERTVMRLVIDALRELAANAGARGLLSDQKVTEVLDRQFANPRRKHLLLLGGDNVQATPGPLPGYRPVQHADRSEVKYELGAYLQRQLGLDGGAIPRDRRTAVLGTARDWCLGEIERRIADVSPDGLLERLIALNESVVRRRFMLQLKVPTRLACYESERETQERLMGEIPESNLAGIVFRFLVEYVTAVPPTGSTPVSTTVTDRLAAVVAEMQEVAMGLDALTKGLSDPELAFNEHGELAFATPGAYLEGQSSFLRAHVSESIAKSDDSFGRHWKERTPGPVLLEATEAEVDAVMVHETGGLSLIDLRRLVEELAKTGLDMSDEPKRMPRADLERKLGNELGWSAEKVNAGIEFLLLRERGSFYSSAQPPLWTKSDVQPWRFNRRLSYVRRPLVERDVSDGPELLWGVRHLWEAWPLQITYLQMSKFKASSKELIKVLGRIGKQRGDEFEVKVAQLYERYPRFEVLRGRDKFNGQYMSRPGDSQEALGDVDVLVAEPDRKALVAVEVKDIAMALTPSELADELAEYFETPDDAKRAAAMDRHQERVAWLKDHIADVLAEFSFNADDPCAWTVEGMFVTDEAVPSPHIIRPALPVLSYRELEARLDNPPPPRRQPEKKRRARRN
jgi:hypothetical protein